MADGAVKRHQLADVRITIDDEEFQSEAAVAEKLAAPVLLGCDLPLEKLFWRRLPKKERERCIKEPSEQMLAVTRQQVKRVQQEEEEKDGGRPTFLVEIEKRAVEELNEEESEQQSEDDPAVCPGVNFDDDLFGDCHEPRPQLTRSQKREGNLKRTRLVKSIMRGNEAFKNAQMEDEEVQCWRSSVILSQILERDGVLLRKWTPSGRPEYAVEQLVLPKSYQQQVLK